jgi:DNA-binding SARP family transcriptional activator/tetratricopeptide (TPR) repeat protein
MMTTMLRPSALVPYHRFRLVASRLERGRNLPALRSDPTSIKSPNRFASQAAGAAIGNKNTYDEFNRVNGLMDVTVEFERVALLARIQRVRPRLVMFVAPAGFGKTTAARQYGATFESPFVCDCFGLSSERDFVRRLIAARSRGGTANTNLAQIQYSVSEAGGSSGDDIEAVLAAWAQSVGSTAVIFENAEALADDSELLKLFYRTLAKTPESCTIVVCTRKALRIPASRIAPPHRIVTVRADDLGFDGAEIGAVFAGSGVSDDVLRRIAVATRGWPIGVFMLRRLADEGRLEHSLDDLNDVALDDMHGYLLDEVIVGLSPEARDVVIACTAFTTPTPADIAALDLLSEHEADERLRAVAPLATAAGDGTYSVHPLLQAALERRYRAERQAFGLAAARRYEADERYYDAAKTMHHMGRVDETARLLCLEAAVATRKPSPRIGALLATLDGETLARYPILRGLMTYSRLFRVDPHVLREETRAIWQTIRDADFQLRCNIGNPLARIMYETGRFDEAEGLLRELESEAGGIPETPRNGSEAYIARTLGCVLARSGRLNEAAGYFQKGYFAISGAEFVMSHASIERAIIERLHGRIDEERRLFDQAIELAVDAKATVHIACALAEAAFAAWLAGNDTATLAYARRLDERVSRDAMRGFSHFCAVIFGDTDANPNGTEQPNWLACAHLIAGAASTGNDRVRHAKAAKAAADASSDRFLRLLGSAALGLALPADSDASYAEALMHAAAIEAPAPQSAVAALMADQSGFGILTAFVSRFRRGGSQTSESIRVDVLTRSVYRNGVPLALPERELALVLALARQRKFYTRCEIAALVWPDSDEDAARETFNSCLYRLRQRLPDVVTYSREGYRLHEHVRVDLRELEHWVSSLSLRRPLRDQERIVFRALYERLRSTTGPADDDERWAWLNPIVRRADDMRRTVAERLAGEALRRGECDEALMLARQLVADDPCDEAAREIAVRAHLQLGRRGEALREFRQYRDVLQRELEAEPSAQLAGLLREA